MRDFRLSRLILYNVFSFSLYSFLSNIFGQYVLLSLDFVSCQTPDPFINLKHFDIDLNHGPFAHPKAKEDVKYLEILRRYTKFTGYDKDRTPTTNNTMTSNLTVNVTDRPNTIEPEGDHHGDEEQKSQWVPDHVIDAKIKHHVDDRFRKLDSLFKTKRV